MPIITGASGSVAAAIVLVSSMAVSLSQTNQNTTNPAPAFPPLKATNLERKVFNLPQDFEGDKNLCLIAFQRDQQKNIDTWMAGLKNVSTPANFRAYELPTISKGPRWFDSWLDGRMRAGIADKHAREMTITLYINKGPFKRALAIPSENTIYAILIDKKGAILWRTEGNYTEAKGKDLLVALGR